MNIRSVLLSQLALFRTAAALTVLADCGVSLVNPWEA